MPPYLADTNKEIKKIVVRTEMKNNEKIHTNKEKKEKCTQMNKYRKLTQRAPGSRRQCRYMRSLSEGPSLMMRYRTIMMMMMMEPVRQLACASWR